MKQNNQSNRSFLIHDSRDIADALSSIRPINQFPFSAIKLLVAFASEPNRKCHFCRQRMHRYHRKYDENGTEQINETDTRHKPIKWTRIGTLYICEQCNEQGQWGDYGLYSRCHQCGNEEIGLAEDEDKLSFGCQCQQTAICNDCVDVCLQKCIDAGGRYDGSRCLNCMTYYYRQLTGCEDGWCIWDDDEDDPCIYCPMNKLKELGGGRQTQHSW